MGILSEQERQNLVNRVVLDAYRRGSHTEHIGTTADEFEKIGPWLRKYLRSERLGVIIDDRSHPIALEHVLPRLAASGVGIELYRLEDPHPGQPPVCSSALSRMVADAFESSPDTILAIGSGTITDISKQVSGYLNAHCVVVATAASMNGFTSSLAATLDNGVKLTVKAPTPKAAWALPAILQSAPPTMTAAGLGDLHSKPVSSADWRLNHLLNDAPWDAPVIAMLDTVNALMDGVADGLAANDIRAYAQLFSGLCLTGIAMQAASPGSQASGAEHLISHYLDMIAGHPDFVHQASDHGAQVAVGCMVSHAAWEFAATAFHEARPYGDIPAHLYDESARNAFLDSHFRGLSSALQSMHARAPQSLEAIERRRAVLRQNGRSILSDARGVMPEQPWLERELRTAGCPYRFEDIGVSLETAQHALLYAPWVRARYTILHLLQECGWYDSFVPYALARCFVSAKQASRTEG